MNQAELVPEAASTRLPVDHSIGVELLHCITTYSNFKFDGFRCDDADSLLFPVSDVGLNNVDEECSRRHVRYAELTGFVGDGEPGMIEHKDPSAHPRVEVAAKPYRVIARFDPEFMFVLTVDAGEHVELVGLI